jgi:hypothetical protein
MVRVSKDARDEACMHQERGADRLSLTPARLRNVKEGVGPIGLATPPLLESPLSTETP